MVCNSAILDFTNSVTNINLKDVVELAFEDQPKIVVPLENHYKIGKLIFSPKTKIQSLISNTVISYRIDPKLNKVKSIKLSSSVLVHKEVYLWNTIVSNIIYTVYPKTFNQESTKTLLKEFSNLSSWVPQFLAQQKDILVFRFISIEYLLKYKNLVQKGEINNKYNFANLLPSRPEDQITVTKFNIPFISNKRVNKLVCEYRLTPAIVFYRPNKFKLHSMVCSSKDLNNILNILFMLCNADMEKLETF